MKAFVYSTKSPVEFLGKFETVIVMWKRITVAKGKNCRNLLSLSTTQDPRTCWLAHRQTSKDGALENILQKNP